MSDPTSGGDVERPMTKDERDTVNKTAAPTTAAAGALAGATAGLVSLAGGPIGMGVGLVLGALGGAAVGAAGGQATTAHYTEEHDEHYRALWEGTPGRRADGSFERARPAYQLGHIAAAHNTYYGRDFDAAEPDLRAAWERDFRAQHGEWDAVRRYVRDAYGHSRSEGYGIRRDDSVIGTGGSAVDPDELARARAGLPSRADLPAGLVPEYPADLAATSPNAGGGAPGTGSLAEGPEIGANQAHQENVDYR
jgi:hypothetical protein